MTNPVNAKPVTKVILAVLTALTAVLSDPSVEHAIGPSLGHVVAVHPIVAAVTGLIGVVLALLHEPTKAA